MGERLRANIVGGAIVDVGLELAVQFQRSNLGICHLLVVAFCFRITLVINKPYVLGIREKTFRFK